MGLVVAPSSAVGTTSTGQPNSSTYDVNDVRGKICTLLRNPQAFIHSMRFGVTSGNPSGSWRCTTVTFARHGRSRCSSVSESFPPDTHTARRVAGSHTVWRSACVHSTCFMHVTQAIAAATAMAILTAIAPACMAICPLSGSVSDVCCMSGFICSVNLGSMVDCIPLVMPCALWYA